MHDFYGKRNDERRNVLKRLLAFVMTLMVMIPYCQISAKDVYAALPKMIEISEGEYYGRQVLSGMENSENLLFVYDQLATGVANVSSSIVVFDANHHISGSEFQMVFEAYINDYPQHFWVMDGYSYQGYSSSFVTMVNPQYYFTASEVALLQGTFDNAVNEVINGIDMSMSEFERELLVHDRIAKRTEYVLNADNAHNAYGAFVEGKAVCEGYARAFQYALYKVGILSATVTGDAGGSHAWNLVRIDGDYYYTDLTWDDQNNATYHAYFNLPSSEISRDHNLDDELEYPYCTATKANYFKVVGGWLDSYTAVGVAEYLDSALVIDIYAADTSTNFKTWFSSNATSVLRAAGITSGYSYGMGSLGKEYKITVSNVTRATTAVTGINVTPTSYVFDAIGAQYQLSASVTPSDATFKNITYTSTNTDVAVVNKYTGVVTAVGSGTASIVATSEEGKSANCTIKVKAQHVCGADTLTKFVAKEATCQAEGNIEYYVCECGKYYADAKANNEITDKSSVVLKKIDHKYGDWQHDETGHWKECVYCGTKTVVTAHTGGTATTTSKAICDECGAEYGDYKIEYGKVIVKYGDTDGNIWKTTTQTGVVGQSYITEALDYEEYELATVSGITSGKYTKADIVVTYQYKKKTEPMTILVSASNATTNLTVGDKLSLTAVATGGSGNYTYSYLVQNKDTNEWYRFSTFKASNTLTWTASSVGNRVFFAEAKDSTGQVVRSKAFSISVSSNQALSITAKASQATVGVGTKVVISGTASGGSGKYTYSILVRNKSTNEWYRFSTFKNANSITWIASSVGLREFYVEVKDSTGKVVRSKAVTVNVTSGLLVEGKASSNITNTGAKVIIAGTASGGKGTYTYSFLVRNVATNQWYRFSDFKATNSIVWTATCAGNRELFVEAKDGTGEVVRSQAVLVTVK